MPNGHSLPYQRISYGIDFDNDHFDFVSHNTYHTSCVNNENDTIKMESALKPFMLVGK